MYRKRDDIKPFDNRIWVLMDYRANTNGTERRGEYV